MKRACAAAVATAAAVALAAGMTGPASAKPGPAARPAAAGTLTAKHRITLITGDRVVLDARGRVAGLERAKGREKVPVQIHRAAGHTYVVPADAAALIASGTLDRRLFDVTGLNSARTRRDEKNGPKVIVGYRGTASAAKGEVREAGTLRRTLTALNADAVQAPPRDTARLWKALTADGGTASGIAHIWLDGVRRASPDTSVTQIGAPKAWAAGYDGKGVKVAVLDTGVYADHPDLKGQVIAAKNFSTAATAADKVGHGTHVASIVAGTGAKSHGLYKGVAPGAKILSGKVLDDEGYGDDSGILAGMEWAAQQGADIVNLSLGGPDTPGVDPLEAEVNKLSEQKGILFAVAAGNDGELGEGTVGSPGSAADALTVGAVDSADKLASFSSRGPGPDAAVKPDVTAPGVNITAAAAPGSLIDKETGEKPPGYLTLSGTSMATPHAAGAAALLKQEHPDWTFAELKSALTGSAKGGAYTPFQQGSGRIAVDRAIGQTVLAQPSSVSFGTARWPHTDDRPLTRQLTYRNTGHAAVTLSLALTATDPRGRPAPAGFFTLGARQVTVPAAGTATVPVGTDTRPGGSVNGAYSAYVTATGGGRSVRTALAVERETESYDVTLKYTDRPGHHPVHLTDLTDLSPTGDARDYFSQTADNTVTIRVPKGTYLLDSVSLKSPDSIEGGADWLVRPRLDVTGATTVTVDLTRTRPADITVPDPAAKPASATVAYNYEAGNVGSGTALSVPSFGDLRIAHLGPAVPSGLWQSWFGQWTKGGTAEYDIFTGARVKKLEGAHVRHYRAGELAALKLNLGAASSGKTGAVGAYAELPEDFAGNAPVEQGLRSTRTLYVSTGEKVQWALDFTQFSATRAPGGLPVAEAYYTLDTPETFRAGRTYGKTFNTAVFGPKVDSVYGIFREGNRIYGLLPLFTDGQNHSGSSDFLSVGTTLYRNGTKVGSNADPLFGQESFTVPSGDASYRLATSVVRSVKVAAASTRIDASWTFRSKKADEAKLPASSVRFGATTGLDSRVAAGRKVTVPVTVEGSAAGRNLGSLGVWVSYDYGRTWTKLTVAHGTVTYRNPARGQGLSFHAKIADKQGNKATISIYNAFYGI
ncbi:S8 family peptidase [Streptomyces sp. NPDC052040]|uniref:S8 family peptidase n=1 Tax=Streptomyces sp. NPDC052040 TaxID=3365682 RepID=UPI0037D39306